MAITPERRRNLEERDNRHGSIMDLLKEILREVRGLRAQLLAAQRPRD